MRNPSAYIVSEHFGPALKQAREAMSPKLSQQSVAQGVFDQLVRAYVKSMRDGKKGELEELGAELGPIRHNKAFITKWDEFLRTSKFPRQGLTRDELTLLDAEYVKVRNRLASYESGRSRPSPIFVWAASRILPLELELTDSGVIQPPTGVEAPAVRFLGLVPAPFQHDLSASVYDLFYCSPEVTKGDVELGTLLAVRIAGESMAPRFLRNQVVVFRRSINPIEGTVVLVVSPEGLLTIKLLVRCGDELCLTDSLGRQVQALDDSWQILGHAIHAEETTPSGLPVKLQ